MKKLGLLFVMILTLISCQSDDNGNNNCGLLPNVLVNFEVNLALPQFQNLLTPQNPVVIPGQGVGGLIVMRNFGDSFVAWDNADPNRVFQTCSIMTVQGTIATSNCEDENKYDINTGLPLTEGLSCGLKPYRIQQGGNSLLISN
ncbi:hypothetical protein [Winogradskyella sp. 3972H.M.0a.05]|uniref:hypothetical protein n=1 Tax=Winogradskyella sp. 3972H.M.0a.05 TaxID=2950277 RepID=UPI00339744CA